jgi:hypothetical protein
MLHDAADGLDAGGAGELVQLGELLVGIDPLSEHGELEPALGLEAGSGIGLSHRHSSSL